MSALITFLISSLILLIVWYIKVWEAPNPPLPVYGLEMNFGFTPKGKGEEQAKEIPKSNPQTEELVEETVEEEVEAVETSEVVEEVTEVQEATETAEDVVEEVVTQEAESPVQAAEATTPKEVAEVKEAVEEVIKEKPKASTKKPTLTYPNQSEESDNKEVKGQGTDKVAGNVGVKEGENTKKALLYEGKVGAGNLEGASLDITGWNWDFEPKPDDKSQESGKIVFQIKIDDQGEVIAVRVIEKSVSASVVQIYKREIENLTFSPTDDQNMAPPMTTGKITFIIRSN